MALPLIPLLGLATQLIDKIFPDPAEKAKAQAALEKAQVDGNLALIQQQLSAIIMEAQSKDKWTSRARPGFLYVVYVYILAALPFGAFFAIDPLIAESVTQGVTAWLQAIPDSMWSLFGVGYLGYVGARSFDKNKLLRK